MYKTAHAWASDAEPIRVTMKDVPGYKNEDGKAGMWEAVFGSTSMRQLSHLHLCHRRRATVDFERV